MLQLLSPDKVAVASTEQNQHAENNVPTIAPQMPLPAQDAIESIRLGLRAVANETARNIQQLSQAMVEQAIDIGQQLWRMQRDLKRKEYGAFLSLLGWATAKARKFINLAKTFDGFEISQLIGVELTTLLSLCSKKYQEVVAQLREVQNITQQMVEQLIKENRQARSPKQDPVTGWKQNRIGGGRCYEVVLHDQETGLSIEQQALSEGILPQRVIEEAVALRSQYKSSPPQISEYYAAQLEELQTVVENARALHSENRKLIHQLQERERTIAELKAKLALCAVPSLAEPSSVQKDEVEIASGELYEYLEEQVSAIMNEEITEYELEAIEATDRPQSERESSYLETTQENEHLVEPGAENLDFSIVADSIQECPPAQQLEAEQELQVIQVGASVEIVSSRQKAEFVQQVGVVKVTSTVGCVVEVLGQILWFCLDELMLVPVSTQAPPKHEKDAIAALKPGSNCEI